MWKPGAKVDQGDDQTVSEDQVVLRADTRLPLPPATTPLAERRLAFVAQSTNQMIHGRRAIPSTSTRTGAWT